MTSKTARANAAQRRESVRLAQERRERIREVARQHPDTPPPREEFAKLIGEDCPHEYQMFLYGYY